MKLTPTTPEGTEYWVPDCCLTPEIAALQPFRVRSIRQQGDLWFVSWDPIASGVEPLVSISIHLCQTDPWPFAPAPTKGDFVRLGYGNYPELRETGIYVPKVGSFGKVISTSLHLGQYAQLSIRLEGQQREACMVSPAFAELVPSLWGKRISKEQFQEDLL